MAESSHTSRLQVSACLIPFLCGRRGLADDEECNADEADEHGAADEQVGVHSALGAVLLFQRPAPSSWLGKNRSISTGIDVYLFPIIIGTSIDIDMIVGPLSPPGPAGPPDRLAPASRPLVVRSPFFLISIPPTTKAAK